LFTVSPIQIIDGDTNFTVSGPDYVDWFAAGTTSVSKNITVDVLSGKNLSACSATPGATVSVFGLPSGVSASLDGGTASQFPTKTTDISAGGSDTVSLQFVAAAAAFPDWFEAYVEVECGSEFASIAIQSGILYDTAFFQYDDGISGYDYYGGTVSVTPFSNNPGDTVTIDASNFTAGDGVEFEVYSYQLSNGFTKFSPSSVTFDDAGSGNGKASIPFVIPSTMTAPGIYSIDVFDDSGKFGFGEFEIVSSTDTFSLSTSPSYLGGIQKSISSTPTTSDIITITLKALSGKNPGSVTLELFGIPTGVTATLNRGETNETTITATDQFTKSMTVTLGVGETKTVTLDYEVSQETVASFGIVDIIATLTSNSSVEKVAFADFEIVGNSSYYTQFNFGFVSATPFSVSPGEQITITNSGFTANSGAQIFMGFDLQGDPFEIAFPSVSGSLFDSNGAKTVTVTVPSFCTASTGTLNVDDKCLAGPGFYPIDVSSAAGFVSLTSGTSAVDQISVNSVNIMSGSVAYTTDLDTTATNVATNINAHTSTPNYDASAIGSIITITPKTTLGTDFNGFAVVSTTSNGKTDTNFVHQTGFADFEVKATTASLSLDSPEVISSLTQGTSNDGIADLTIKLSALSGSNPDSTTLSLFGLPSEVTPYVSTDGGQTYTAKTTSVMATVTVPPGGEKTIQIDFAVSASASSSFLPLYVEADPLNGDTVGQPVDLSIVPSSADAAVFGVATVSVDPFAAEENDLITLSMSGFTANERPRIYIAGVEYCDSIGADPDNHATCSDSGNTELSDDTKFNANGALNQLAIKVPDLNPDAPGLYDITVEDESGRFGSTLFEVLSATNDFNLNVSPAFIDPIEQGESSSAISINTSAVSGKNPGTVTLKVFGLPPEIDTTIAGTLVSNTVRTGTGVDVTLGIGASETTSLVISPTASVAPGLYFMTIEASSSNSLQFFDTAVEVLPGGNIDLTAFETISINPQFGEVGDIINVKASGFTPSALVTLKIAGGSDLATGTTAFSATGTFSTSVKIPTGINPGLYTVKISDGTKDATEFVEILASGAGFILSVSPDSLPPVIQGTSTGDIKVKVSSPVGVDAASTTIKVFGLPPDVTVKFDGVTGTSKSLNPGVGGTVSTIINIVAATTTPPGFYGLTIEANDGTTFSGLPVGISVSPDLGSGTTFATLTLNPSSLSPGEDLSLSGTGFESGSTFTSLQIEIPGSPTVETISVGDTITVDANGKWNTLVEVPDGVITGHYLLSVTAGDRTAEANLDIIPEDDEFFDVDFTPDFLKVTQNTAVTAGPTSSMIVGGSNGFGGSGDNLALLVDGLPLGMSVQLQTSAGSEIVTYRGTLQGNSVTKGGSAATLGTDDVLTGGTDILPGKQTTLLAQFGTSTNTSTGTYQIFIGAESDNDISGRPLTVEVRDSGTSLTISPTGGKILGTATISGEGFAANTAVTLNFGGNTVGTNSFTTTPTTIISDGAGKFTGYVVVPNLVSGTYSVTATDGTNDGATTYQILSSTENTFTLQVGPKKALILDGGSSATQTVTVKPVGLFSAPITVSLGVPTGLTVSPTSKIITPTPGVSSIISFTLTDGAINPGTVTYDVTASSASITKTASASAEIQAVNDFTFAFGPDEVIVEAGGDPVVVNTKATTVSGGVFTKAISVSATDVGPLTFNETQITIDANDLLGTGTITVTAGDTAVLGEHTVPLTVTTTDGGGVTKNPNLTVIVVAGATEEITTKGIDPATISDLLPGIVLPKYGDGINPAYKFTSLTTDSLSNTAILTTKVDASLTTLSNVLTDANGVPLAADTVSSFGNQIYNIGIGDGVTQLDVEVCLPVTSLDTGITATSLLFFSITNDRWEQIPVTSNDGVLICGNTDHLSSWAVGGVKALALGSSGSGSGSVSAPSFTTPPPSFSFGGVLDADGVPVKIKTITFDITSLENEVKKQIIETGESTEFKFAMFENSGGDNLTHFEFLINLTGDLREYHNSDTYIIYDKYEELIINDPNGFFKHVDFDISSLGRFEALVDIDITFANAMPESDILLRTWDLDRNSQDILLKNAIEILDTELSSIDEVVSVEPIDTEPIDVEQVLNLPEWIKKNAKYWGEGKINDDTFIQGVEFLIQKQIIDLPIEANVSLSAEEKEQNKLDLTNETQVTTEIPSWVRNTAQWWSQDQLSDVEFVHGLKWLIQNEIIVIV
jgi:hypothetical protein